MTKNFFGLTKGFGWKKNGADGTNYYDQNEDQWGNLVNPATGERYDNVSNLENPLHDQSTQVNLSKEAKIKGLLDRYQNLEELNPDELKQIKHLI